MKLKLLTYNLWYGKGLADAKKLLHDEEPDILCVQEHGTNHESLEYLNIAPYKLGCWTNSFFKNFGIFGIAMYYNADTIEVLETGDNALPESTYDLLIFLRHGLNMTRRFTYAKLRYRPTGKEFILYNTHLTHFSFVDLRISQIKTVFEDIKAKVDETIPLIITGDFNLYNGKTELELLMNEYNLQEATSNLAYTFQRNWLWFSYKTKLDYILYRNLNVVGTRRFDRGSSDHHPVMTEFEI